ncbi:MAG: redoxin domain-containing protein [Planctomycetes bacterium]|nr:redoxin domain-containing protein [Planctomycetota bacterium]
MARYLTLAALAVFAMTAAFSNAGGVAQKKQKDKDIMVKGILTKDDVKDPQRGGPSQIHVVKLQKGKTYTIDMVSSQMDSYLRLQDAKGKQLAEDDDSGGGLNARIQFSCTADGDYRIVTTTFAANAMGAFTLTVKTAGASQGPGTAHAGMLGKAAPGLSADFAVNGKPLGLADLKGKVVLLYFWEPRSSASAALLPRLGQWNKAFKDKGLAIVGATFYLTDIGQNLTFDKETGLVKKGAKANRKSDQAILTDYAAYHKIDHLLLALAKKEALAAFDAYIVNGLPQMVLIDRRGMVRMIEVGGEKASTGVEAEIKKLLAEK